MIKLLKIKNFKCFESQTLALGQLTLLSGLNGMGKSSVIQALLLLRQSFEQGMLQGVGLSLNGDYTKIGTAKDALFEAAKEDKLGFSLEFAGGGSASWEFAYDPETDVIHLISSPVEQTIYQEALFGQHFHYLQAERLGPRTSFPTSDYQVRRLRKIGILGEFAVHFLSVFGAEAVGIAALHHPRADSLKLRDQVEAWLGEISPGTRLHYTIHAGLDAVNLEYSFLQGKAATKHYRATNVGFGLTYTLPVLIAILSARPGTLLLLENPEAHLHPRGQLQIGRMLTIAANAGVQVLVETHSDHVLNGIRVGIRRREGDPQNVRLHFFQRAKAEKFSATEIVSPKLDADGRIEYWPDGFFDEFDRALADLLAP